MKRIYITYNNVEEYSQAYKRYEENGFNVLVVLGMELTLSISGDEIAYLDIVNAEKFFREKEFNNQKPIKK